jgi:Dimerisation domain
MDEHQAELVRMITEYLVTQAIHVAAALSIADLLAHGPRASDQLAESAGAYPDALYRLLRALASVGVFREEDGRRFALTPAGEYLRTVAGCVRLRSCRNGCRHLRRNRALLSGLLQRYPQMQGVVF